VVGRKFIFLLGTKKCILPLKRAGYKETENLSKKTKILLQIEVSTVILYFVM